MIKTIQSKTILSPLRSNGYDPFGIAYNMNLYRGCQHQCIYCDSRSTCYQIENFADILIKDNAIELLVKELAGKRKKLTIGTGSMNDPYMPVEKELGLTRQALEQIARFYYPVHIITKSDLVSRDIDLIKDISRTYAAVSFTITTPDDELSAIIEPGAPSSSRRFDAMKHLSREGIYTGIIISPVLPWITDSPENIGGLLRRAHDAGAKYALAWPGMTLRRGQREWYYDKLDKHFPGVKEKYIEWFGNTYQCESLNAEAIHKTYYNVCRELRLATKMKFYEPIDPQLDLFGNHIPA
ncbi:MAG: radical SAM protein [FCB group bacterium]|nr:radical SAM protein [FCB group bacterium]